ncbi:hypothetical protein B7486_53370, partial [cyanobacterium TDX16]
WVFRPPSLRDGASAPVVVYLHGFALLAPDIYADHILHLVRQGVIVVYPQINQGGLNLLGDNSQSNMLDRAIGSTNTALAWLGASAGPRHLFGHSLGGLLGATWTHRGGPALASLVLANPSTAAPPVGSGLPWAAMAPATTARTTILTGEDDTIAAPSQSDALFDAMPAAASRIVYEAQTDTYGNPSSQDLVADHSAPAQDLGFLESFPFNLFLDSFGGPATLDALDSRFYWAALDASIDGALTVPFAMGQWSDGTQVTAPVVRRQDVPSVPAAPTLQALPGNAEVALSWTPGADGGAPITGYRVLRDGSPIVSLPATSTAHLDVGRTNGTTYEYEVAALNLAGEGPPSAVVEATPQAPPPDETEPGAPTDVQATPGDEQLVLSWSPPTDDGGAAIEAYLVYLDGELVQTTDGTTTTAVGGLTNGATYQLEVAAENAVGIGPRAGVTATPEYVAPAEATFADVPLDHPFFLEVEWLAGRGITEGYADGTFRPGSTVTRQAFAAFLQRFRGATDEPAPPAATFDDVSPTHPFFAAIEWAAAEGLVTGYDDGTFRPGAIVTRRAAAAFLHRLLDPTFVAPTAATFDDVAVGAPFFLEVEWLASTGITTGYGDGTFRPGAPVTRQSTAAFLFRTSLLGP